MSKLEALLNFSNSEGEVITFFDGKLTLSQLLVVIGAILAIFLVLKFIKGIIKAVVTIAIVCYAMIYFGIASPQQLKDVSSQIVNNGASFYESFVESSSSIRYENDKLLIKIDEDTWIDVSDVKSFVTGKEGVVTIQTSNGAYTISDSEIIRLLETFK